jgi:hypothetical protein
MQVTFCTLNEMHVSLKYCELIHDDCCYRGRKVWNSALDLAKDKKIQPNSIEIKRPLVCRIGSKLVFRNAEVPIKHIRAVNGKSVRRIDTRSCEHGYEALTPGGTVLNPLPGEGPNDPGISERLN